MERLHNLLNKYEAYQAEKHKELLANWPPHSLLCECKHRCKAKPRKYWSFLKKELVWGKDGHLI